MYLNNPILTFKKDFIFAFIIFETISNEKNRIIFVYGFTGQHTSAFFSTFLNDCSFVYCIFLSVYIY